VISDALASAMKPNPKRRRATTSRARRAARIKAFPRDKQKRLALTGRQLSHRCRQTSAHLSRRLPTQSRPPGKTLQPGGQRASATVGAVLVCQHATSDPEQPRQRIIPDRIQPAPRHQERLRHDILNRRGRRPAKHITPHRPVMRREQPLEHHRRILMTTHPTPNCPAHPASLHHRHGTARRVRRAVLETTEADLPNRSSRAAPATVSSASGQRTPPRRGRQGIRIWLVVGVAMPNVICDGSQPLDCGGLAPRAATWSTAEQRIAIVAKLRGSSRAVDEFASANAQAAGPLSAARSASVLPRESTCERDRPRQRKAAVPESRGGLVYLVDHPRCGPPQMHHSGHVGGTDLVAAFVRYEHGDR
jgi:hypothetical protein